MTDRTVALVDVKTNGMLLKKYPQFKDDFELVLCAVMENGLALQYASDNLLDECDIVIPAIKRGGKAYNSFSPLRFASTNLKSDRITVIYAVKQQGCALKYASKSLQSDLEIVLFAVKQDGLALEYASYDLQCNIDVILTAMNQNKHAFEYIGKEVYYDHIMMHSIVKIYGVALCYASPEINNNREIVLTAVKQTHHALTYASDKLREDREIVLTAVLQNGNAIYYAGVNLQLDREIIIEALRHGLFDEELHYKLGIYSKDLQNLYIYAASRIATQGTKFPIINVELNDDIITCTSAISGAIIHTQQIHKFTTWGDIAKYIAHELDIDYVHIVHGLTHITTLMTNCNII